MANQNLEEGSSEDTAELNRMRLSFGEVMQLQFTSAPDRFHVRLVGYLENRSIIVTAPIKDRKIVRVRTGEPLNVRTMVNGQACAFTTSVLHIYQIPYVHIHLEYPTELFTTFVRKAIRVETKVEATVVNRSIGDRARKIECYLADISETGAHLVTPIRIGKTGDSIDLVLSLNIGGMKRILNVPSILRRRLKAKTASDEREVHYGVEFLPLDDMERLEMIAFVYSKYSELG